MDIKLKLNSSITSNNNNNNTLLPISPKSKITNNIRKLRLSNDSNCINSSNSGVGEETPITPNYNTSNLNTNFNSSQLSNEEKLGYELEIYELKNKLKEYDALLKSYQSKDSNNIKLSNIVSNDLEIKLENLNKYNSELLNIISQYDIELNKWRNRALSLNNKRSIMSPANKNRNKSFNPPNENISPDFNLTENTTIINPFMDEPQNIPLIRSPTANSASNNLSAWLPKINNRDEKKVAENNSDDEDSISQPPSKEYLSLNPPPKTVGEEFHSNLSDIFPIFLIIFRKSCFKEILFQTDKELMFKKLTEQAFQLVGADRSAVFVVNELKREFIAKHSSSRSADRM